MFKNLKFQNKLKLFSNIIKKMVFLLVSSKSLVKTMNTQRTST